MPSTSNENFQLLEVELSEPSTMSDIPDFVVAKPKRKKIRKRKFRNDLYDRRHNLNDSNKYEECCNCYAQNASTWFFIVFMICWITTLTSVTYVLHEQLVRLDANMKEVVGSNQGVPEALQKCHSVSKGLQQNQTQLAQQLNSFRQQIDNFTQQVNDIKNELNQVQQRLKENPDLVTIPQQVTYLSKSVGEFGSQMKDVQDRVTSLKDQNTKFITTTAELVQNITALQSMVALVQHANVSSNANNLAIPKELLKTKEELTNVITKVQNNITLINETLSKQLQWTIEDQHKDHKLIESLQEMNQSVSARISSLEGSCSKTANDQNESFSLIRNLTQEINDIYSKSQTVDTQLMTLQAKVRDLDTKNTEQTTLLSNLVQSKKQNIAPTIFSQTSGKTLSPPAPNIVPTLSNGVTSSPENNASSTPNVPHQKPKTLSSS